MFSLRQPLSATHIHDQIILSHPQLSLFLLSLVGWLTGDWSFTHFCPFLFEQLSPCLLLHVEQTVLSAR